MEDFINMMVLDGDDDNQDRKISTLVFMDLEATGLPSLIGKKNVHITEISLVAIDRTDFETDSSLRVLNKLSLCVRPRTAISPTAMSITGLYNDVLDNQEKFDESVPKLLEYFFRRLRRPLCLLAHNGKRYDFPLLQAELKNIKYGLDPGILCADTLEAFRFIAANPSIPCDDSFLKIHIVQETGPNTTRKDSSIEKDTAKEVLSTPQKIEQNHTVLDEEIDNLLSESMDIFQDIEEPIPSIEYDSKPKSTKPNLTDVVQGHPSTSKINPFLDERTPPKSNSQEELSNPKPTKKLKQDPTLLSKDHYKDNVSTNFMHTQAKRKLFANGTSNATGSTSKTSPSRPVQFSLEKLYNYYFGEAPPQSHYAEADCIALSKICQRVNKDFLKWVDENSKSFSETKAMW